LYLYELIKFDVLECKCVIDVLVNQYRCILTLFSRAHKSLMILLIALNLSLVPQKRNCCVFIDMLDKSCGHCHSDSSGHSHVPQHKYFHSPV